MELLLIGNNCVASDAVACRVMGFEPEKVEHIMYAHERGLGVGRVDEIEIVGDADAAAERWGFHTGNNAVASVGKMFWFGPLRWLQRLMFRTPIVYAFILASAVYHDRFWYPSRGKPVVDTWLRESPWGRLFESYPE